MCLTSSGDVYQYCMHCVSCERMECVTQRSTLSTKLSSSGTGRYSDSHCLVPTAAIRTKSESTVGSVHDFWAGRLTAKGLNGNGSCWKYCSGNVRKRNDPTISAV